ncbi:lipocalin family protein [Aquimarina agarilytica]|uniref:lipocalin family protein n=1 Tax=Aquimarina agarilytica TaxID=1087449 RepID=UPI0002880B92|nr:DUF4923 family protein [Aquimarina agarilytica]
MKTITLLLFTFISLNTYAQKAEAIIGQWVFKDAYNKENLDKAGLEYMNAEILNKCTFIFKADGQFESHIMDEAGTGTWKLNKETKKITVTNGQGYVSEFTILKSSKNELAVKLEMGEFLLTRGTNLNQVTSTSN